MKSRAPVRRLGLSATLGDMDAARSWLRPGEPDRVRFIEDKTDEKTVRLKLYGYLVHRVRRMSLNLGVTSSTWRLTVQWDSTFSMRSTDELP